MIKLHGLGLLASLPVDEAGVDHGEGGAARGGFDEGVEGPIGVGADATVAVLEALPPEEQRHGLPQRPQRLAPRATHQRRRAEIGVVEGGGDLRQHVVGERREFAADAGRGRRRRTRTEARGACGGEFGTVGVREGGEGARPCSVLHLLQSECQRERKKERVRW